MRIEIMIDIKQKISQDILAALESQLDRNLYSLYPSSQGSANGMGLSGVKQA